MNKHSIPKLMGLNERWSKNQVHRTVYIKERDVMPAT